MKSITELPEKEKKFFHPQGYGSVPGCFDRVDVLVCLGFIIVTLAVYWQVSEYEFVNYDDGKYVLHNVYVRDGLTLKGATWAFTDTSTTSNWHPLTWLSHMAVVEWYGLDPGMHHLANVLLHLLNAVLLFLVFKKMTRRRWKSVFVAAFFALHPLHVESVAWISERKDVLSTLFWILTVWAYLRYVEHRRIARYILVVAFLSLGLMSKAMLITLPFVLLLLDYWPLGRVQGLLPGKGSREESTVSEPPLPILSLVREKVPFVVISMFVGITAVLTQKSTGSLTALETLPLVDRLSNVMISYVAYILKTAWPQNLAVFYPIPDVFPLWKVAMASLAIGIITMLTVLYAKRLPFLSVGWWWYLGTLVPVIGLVHIGEQAMADRYTYVPLIGLSIIIAWGVPKLVPTHRVIKRYLPIVSAVYLAVLSMQTWLQVQYWQNSVTLAARALDVAGSSHIAHNNMGCALIESGRFKEALPHFFKVLDIDPNEFRAHYNVGLILLQEGRYGEAVEHFCKVLKRHPDHEQTHLRMGIALAQEGRTQEALTHYYHALRIDPNYKEAHNYLGVSLEEEGGTKEAVRHFAEALRISPYYREALTNLESALNSSRDEDESIGMLRDLQEESAENPVLYYEMGRLHLLKKDFEKAEKSYRRALTVYPEYAPALEQLAWVYTLQKRNEEALALYEKVDALRPGNAGVSYNIACLYGRQKKTSKSIAWLEKAISQGFDNWELIKEDEDLENIRGTAYFQKLMSEQ